MCSCGFFFSFFGKPGCKEGVFRQLVRASQVCVKLTPGSGYSFKQLQMAEVQLTAISQRLEES